MVRSADVVTVMFRSIFGKDSNGSARQRQVKTLRIYNKDVTEQPPDQYYVSFDAGGCQYQLSIFLPTGYPEDRPLLRVCPGIQHPWVDANQMVTGAPGIVNYTKHCDLGQLVQNIVNELQKSVNGGRPSQTAAAAVSTGSTRHRSYFPTPSAAAPPSVPQPEPEYPELWQLSQEQLRQLLDDEDRLDELVDRLPQVSAVYQQLEAAMERCQRLAAGTLSRESSVATLRDSVASAQLTAADQLSSFEAAERRYEQLVAGRYSPPLLLQLLQIASAEAEEQSDATAEQLMSRAVDVDAFVRQYMQQRTLYGMRRTKQERLRHQLRELELSYPGSSKS